MVGNVWSVGRDGCASAHNELSRAGQRFLGRFGGRSLHYQSVSTPAGAECEYSLPCIDSFFFLPASALPLLSVGKYLERIAHYSECSDEALVMAFIHISRISHNKPGFHLNALSIHRLLLTAIMCTAKYFDDSYYNNNFYSKIGGGTCDRQGEECIYM